MNEISVIRVSGQTSLQDQGRPGLAHLGIPPSGAVDGPSLAAANRLVGNPSGLAGLEITVGGLILASAAPVVVALTGAPGPLTVDDRPAPLCTPVCGRRFSVGLAASGLRRYLAVAGGFDVPAVFGSRSTDTLSGLGPEPLKTGDVLPVGDPAGLPSGVDWLPVSVPPAELTIGVRFGPRDDWFAEPDRLLRDAYTVSVMSDRVGARLEGPALTRAKAGELPSEPVVTGAVQVPADGKPLIFLSDHPTTGGYPVIAVVAKEEVPRLAQARPGTSIRFVRTTPRPAP
ncbi:5-oxoprolinase subunit C family protein [Hamadaea tsunoensis]|uniref:5-oxoprolinase subunit C family protein n=1 Tax=Hamadaea tsunoensis TaxID=53368 RepID=UPI0003FD47D1|nr:biotin-dependent carboxyltransferase family protein [Hamadaea tsunoensis]